MLLRGKLYQRAKASPYLFHHKRAGVSHSRQITKLDTKTAVFINIYKDHLFTTILFKYHEKRVLCVKIDLKRFSNYSDGFRLRCLILKYPLRRFYIGISNYSEGFRSRCLILKYPQRGFDIGKCITINLCQACSGNVQFYISR